MPSPENRRNAGIRNKRAGQNRSAGDKDKSIVHIKTLYAYKREEEFILPTYRKWIRPYIGRFDPCPPLTPISYETPAQLYLGFQPAGMQQFSPDEALSRGTLWPGLYTPYTNPYLQPRGEG